MAGKFRNRIIRVGLLGLFLTAGMHTPAPAAPLQSCVKNLQRIAVKSGISAALTRRALGKVAFDEKAVRFSRTQPEYVTPIWDYMAFLVDRERISTGKQMFKKHRATLRAVERAYGIDAYYIAALWGVESNFGQIKGDFFLPHALANVICAGRKPAFFRKQLIAALKLVQRGDLKLGDLQGSWAGAFGQTQFLPTTYQRLAVDFNRDGRRDLVHSIPDALASTANYLRRAGWRKGQGWGFEVKLPKTYRGPVGRKRRASLNQWRARGLVRVNGKTFSGETKAGLLLPAGRRGPAFLVFRNFTALYTYNAAESYALAISHLADRLRGKGPIKTPWPTNDPGLSRAQRLELQKRLLKSGFDIGEADGRIGPITQAAIRRAEKKFGMKPTGRPGTRIFNALAPK